MPSAPQKAAAEPAEAGAPEERERRFSLAMLKYPAVAVAIIGLMSAIFAEPIRTYVDTWLNPAPTVAAESRLAILFKRNQDCLRIPPEQHPGPDGIVIQSSVCPTTGDIYLVFDYPSEGVFKRKIGGVLLRETLQEGIAGFVITGVETPPEVGQASAMARALTRHVQAAASAADLRLAQAGEVVLCHSFPPRVREGTIVRKVQQGSVCHMETIQAATGMVTERLPVPCTQPCP